MFYKHIVLFASESEKENFCEWCDNNPKQVDEAKKGVNIDRVFKFESFKSDAFATAVIKKLLEQYRTMI